MKKVALIKIRLTLFPINRRRRKTEEITITLKKLMHRTAFNYWSTSCLTNAIEFRLSFRRSLVFNLEKYSSVIHDDHSFVIISTLHRASRLKEGKENVQNEYNSLIKILSDGRNGRPLFHVPEENDLLLLADSVCLYISFPSMHVRLIENN